MTGLARYWRETCTAETCRVCGERRALQRAHVIPRRYDPTTTCPDCDGVARVGCVCRGKGRVRYVHPRAVVTLCERCHRGYDAGALDLLPHLTLTEQALAVERVGIVAAARYIMGRDRAEQVTS